MIDVAHRAYRIARMRYQNALTLHPNSIGTLYLEEEVLSSHRYLTSLKRSFV